MPLHVAPSADLFTVILLQLLLMTDPDLVLYYKARAKEYDKLYTREDRQDALREASEILKTIFAGKEVFEIACGTGYWTQQMAMTAKSILATDINDEMLAVAKTKSYGPAPVVFENRDQYAPTERKYESLFAGFVWSHILLQDRDKFIDVMNSHVAPGGTVVFIDNRFAEGSNLPITGTDAQGNTYQTRTLDNGTQHKVLKNFPAGEEMQKLFAGKVNDFRFIALEYYWIAVYENVGQTRIQ